MSVLEVCKVIGSHLVLSSQINWLMSICLSTLVFEPLVDFPGPISVPDCPIPIPDFEMLLKAFAKPPLQRLIIYNNFAVFLCVDQLFDRKELSGESFPSDCDKFSAADLDNYPTFLKWNSMIVTVSGRRF